MERLAIAAMFLTALATFASPCYGFCMPSIGWHARSLVERIDMPDADFVILAYVNATDPEPPLRRHPYTANLDVECYLKDKIGASSFLPPGLTDVQGFGGMWDCAETNVIAGERYIVLLYLQNNVAVVAEVNGQVGAEKAIPSRLEKVQKKYKCV